MLMVFLYLRICFPLHFPHNSAECDNWEKMLENVFKLERKVLFLRPEGGRDDFKMCMQDVCNVSTLCGGSISCGEVAWFGSARWSI